VTWHQMSSLFTSSAGDDMAVGSQAITRGGGWSTWRDVAVMSPVYTTLMYQYWDYAQVTSYIHMGKTPPAKKNHIAVCAGAHLDY